MDNGYIDLSDSVNCPAYLQYCNDSPKRTGTGLHFCSYQGLRMYLITGKKDGRYLQGASQYINENDKFIHVPDLLEQMEAALKLNLSRFPLMVSMLKLKKPEVVWTSFGIRDSELEWVNIVRRVLATL